MIVNLIFKGDPNFYDEILMKAVVLTFQKCFLVKIGIALYQDEQVVSVLICQWKHCPNAMNSICLALKIKCHGLGAGKIDKTIKPQPLKISNGIFGF